MKHLNYILILGVYITSIPFIFAQQVKVIDQKGTIKNVTSNSVTTSNTAPTTAVESDIWIDTSTNSTKVWDGTSWKTMLSNSSLQLWDADADTGIQVEESADEDNIRFDTAAAERMIIDNNGKVGIGTSSPSAGLHVTIPNPSTPMGSATEIVTGFESYSDANFSLYNATTEHGPVARLFNNGVETGGEATHVYRTTDGQDWGIGYQFSTRYYITSIRLQARGDTNRLRTGGGQYQLYRNGSLVFTSGTIASPVSVGAWTTSVTPNVIADEVRYIFANGVNPEEGTNIFNASEFEIVGQQLQAESVSIISEGDVGIGTSSPSEKLHVAGGIRVENLATGTATDYLVVVDANGVFKKIQPTSSSASATSPWYGSDDNQPATSNTEDVYMMGDVGVGLSTNPTTKLDVNGAIKVGGGAVTSGGVCSNPGEIRYAVGYFFGCSFRGGSISTWQLL